MNGAEAETKVELAETRNLPVGAKIYLEYNRADRSASGKVYREKTVGEITVLNPESPVAQLSKLPNRIPDARPISVAEALGLNINVVRVL